MGNRGRSDTHNRQVTGHRTQTDRRQRRSREFKFGFTHSLNYSSGFFTHVKTMVLHVCSPSSGEIEKGWICGVLWPASLVGEHQVLVTPS